MTAPTPEPDDGLTMGDASDFATWLTANWGPHTGERGILTVATEALRHDRRTVPPLPAGAIPVTVHEIAVDGLPQYDGDDDLELAGRVAFIFDGNVVSGWHLGLEHGSNEDGTPYWEADSDVGRLTKFAGVTHWLEFPIPVHRIAPLPTNRKAHL